MTLNLSDYLPPLLILAAGYVTVFYVCLPRMILIEAKSPFRWSIYKRLPNSFAVWPGLFAVGLILPFTNIGIPYVRLIVAAAIVAPAIVLGWHIGQSLAVQENTPDGRTP